MKPMCSRGLPGIPRKLFPGGKEGRGMLSGASRRDPTGNGPHGTRGHRSERNSASPGRLGGTPCGARTHGGFVLLASFMLLALAGQAGAGIDLAALPERESVQLTIYNSADLTLVREIRKLTLRKGINKLSFGWSNTLIDPTSLNLRALQRPDAVRLLDVTYPARVSTKAVWTVQSQLEGEVAVEMTYFTSGITWRAFYVATLTQDQESMGLQGYVRVTNNSGEDYRDARIRLVVGKVHLLEQIAELARRPVPYGMPGEPAEKGLVEEKRMLMRKAETVLDAAAASAPLTRPKEIIKEGLSEYFLYTIEGTENLPHGWSKRLQSLEARGIPVGYLYKFEEERYGREVVRVLLFSNDKEHRLGETPLSDGLVKVFRQVDPKGHLSYEGADRTQLVPVGEKVELNLGPTRKIMVTPTMVRTRTENFSFNHERNINGWEEVQDWKLEVKNTGETPARVEITRNMRHQYWDLMPGKENYGRFQKDDMDTVKFTLDLEPGQKRDLTYTVRYFEGERRSRR